MNRIRKVEDKYQVLITPDTSYFDSTEHLKGNWTDENFRNYYINEYDNLGDAQIEALKYPNIDWDKLVLSNENNYYDIKKYLKEKLDKLNYVIDFYPRILSGEETKEIFFNRVMYYGKRFTLKYQMNDIICFHIVNPYTSNLEEIGDILCKDYNLHIQKKYKNHIIQLIGKTSQNITYEICLWPSLIYNWAKWVDNNKKLDVKAIKSSFLDVIDNQKKLDNNVGFN